MKYLQDNGLSALSAALADAVVGGDASSSSACQRVVHGRIEAYTTKRAGGDKKYAQQLGERFVAEMECQENLLAAAAAAVAAASATLQEDSGHVNNRSNNGGGGGQLKLRKRSQSVGHLEDVTSRKLRRIAAVGDGADIAGGNAGPPPTVSWADEENAENEGLGDDSNRSGGGSRRGAVLGSRRRLYHIKRQQQQQQLPGGAGRSRSVSFDATLSPPPKSSTRSHQPQLHSHPKFLGTSPTLCGSGTGGNDNKTALGDFAKPSTRRLLTDLILTLNASFPDYDFGSVKATDFIKLPVTSAVRKVNEKLTELALSTPTPTTGIGTRVPNTAGGGSPSPSRHRGSGKKAESGGATGGAARRGTRASARRPGPSTGSNFLGDLWRSIDSVISLAGSDVYSYQPLLSRNGDCCLEDDPLSFLTQTLVGGENGSGDADVVTSSARGAGGAGSAVGGAALARGSTVGSDSSDTMIATADDGSRETALWSFNYFFVNKTARRIVFFACIGTMRSRVVVPADDDEEYGYNYELGEYYYHGAGNDRDEDDEEEAELVRFSPSSESASDMDFDLDPSAVTAGGIPVSTA